MNIEQLRVFSDVYRTLSFAKVAQRRDVAPSIISRAVASLEDELGVALLYRTTRSIKPTEAGVLFYNKIDRLIAELEDAISSAQNLRSTPSGVLRITAPVSFGVLFLPKLVQKFKASYPEVEVELLITDSIVDIVEQRIDLAFRFGHLPDSSFVVKKLTTLEYVVCASPDFIRKHGRPKEIHDVSRFSCIQFLISGFNDGWKFRAKDEAVQLVIPGKGVRASNALALRELALSGAGIALLPRLIIERELKSKTLIQLFPRYEVTATDFGASIWMLYPSKQYLPEKTRLFIDLAISSKVIRPT